MDDARSVGFDGDEAGADAWSSQIHIPSRCDAIPFGLNDNASVVEFARQINIHPEIVAGRLQHGRILGYGQNNDLMEEFELWQQKHV